MTTIDLVWNGSSFAPSTQKLVWVYKVSLGLPMTGSSNWADAFIQVPVIEESARKVTVKTPEGSPVKLWKADTFPTFPSQPQLTI